MAVTVNNPLEGWPVLLSVAAPFVIALFFVGRYLIARLDAAEAERKALYEKIISDFVPIIGSATNAITTNSASLNEVLEFVKDLKEELVTERELRIRFEERLGMGPLPASPQRRRRGPATQEG